MASAALMLGGAAANALAFSGSNYLFSKLKDKDVDKERLRHDKAVEQLQAAQAEWSKRRTERLDWINESLSREKKSVRTFQNADDAMREYYVVTGRKLPPLPPKPELEDFYTPSEGQKSRELAFVTLVMASVFAGLHLVSR